MSQSMSLRHRGCRNTDGDNFRRYTLDEDTGTLIGLNCTKCLSEWVTADYVRAERRGSEEMEIDGKTFHLVKKSDVDESTLTTETTGITDADNLADYLKAADHVRYQWFGGFFHHAIVKDVQKKANGCDHITLIHWQGGQGGGGPKTSAMIIEEIIADMASKASVIYRCEYSDHSVPADDKVLTLARAVAWVGEAGYDLTEKNCEHFAVFCKTGLHWSSQGEMVKGAVSSVVRGIIPYEDELVENITDLSVGDQVVMFMTIVHPRCHMIVTSIDALNGEIGVIRFTYQNGVVEEELKFRKPMYRVISESTFGLEEAIERARNPQIRLEYNIMSFNCKHFAFWCKTGMIPQSP